MEQFLPPTPMQSPPFPTDGSDQSHVCAVLRSTPAWSLEADPFHASASNFWQDMQPYLCSAPPSPYPPPYQQEDTPPSGSGSGPEDGAADPPSAAASRRARSEKASPEVILRRRAQNRASQRAYRDRKDRRVKELEARIEEMAESHDKLSLEHSSLCAAHQQLQAELQRRDARARADDARWRPADDPAQVGLRLDLARPGDHPAAPPGLIVKVLVCKGCFGDGAPGEGT